MEGKAKGRRGGRGKERGVGEDLFFIHIFLSLSLQDHLHAQNAVTMWSVMTKEIINYSLSLVTLAHETMKGKNFAKNEGIC